MLHEPTGKESDDDASTNNKYIVSGRVDFMYTRGIYYIVFSLLWVCGDFIDKSKIYRVFTSVVFLLYPLVQLVSCCTMGHASHPSIPVVGVPYTEQRFRLFARDVFQNGPTCCQFRHDKKISTSSTLHSTKRGYTMAGCTTGGTSSVAAEPFVGFRVFRTTYNSSSTCAPGCVKDRVSFLVRLLE